MKIAFNANNRIFKLVFTCIIAAIVLTVPVWANNGIQITVSKDDTVSSISSRYLNNPSQWAQLMQVNKLSANATLKPGQVLTIPENLLVKPLGTIRFKTGGVFRRSGDRNFQAINLNERLFEDDVIQSQNGKVLVMLFNGAKLQIEPNTLLTIKRAHLGNDVSAVSLDKGKVYSMVNPSDKKSSYRVFTPSSVAAVRGTEFLTEVDDNGNSVVTCYKGSVSVEAQAQEVIVNAGQSVNVVKGQKPSAVKKVLNAPQIIKIEQ